MINHSLIMLAGLALAAPAAFAAAKADDSAVDVMALYSHGSAVVQDSRRIKLKKGEQTVSWPVSGDLQPDTLWLAGDGVRLDGFVVAARNGSSQGLLAGRVGQHITVTGADGQKQRGTLVAAEGDTAYVRVDGRIERVSPASPGRLSWPAAQKTGHDAAITLQVAAAHAGKQKITAIYQTNAPSWQVSYTGRFDPKRGRLELTGAAIIDNSGHAAVSADKAWLVAGQISRANQRPRPALMAKSRAADVSAAGPPQRTGDVYRYLLKHGLHVAAGTTRSISLIRPMTVHAKRQYRFVHDALARSYFNGRSRVPASIILTFKNVSKQPLPAGVVRIYDASRAALLMGGAQMSDTPPGASVELGLGSAFDLTGTHHFSRHVSRDSAGHIKTRSATVTMNFENAGDRARQITVVENIPDHARLADNAPKPSGGTADRPQWRIRVPAHGHANFSYDLRIEPSGS